MLAHKVRFVGTVQTRRIWPDDKGDEAFEEVFFQEGETLVGVIYALVVNNQNGVPTECADIMEQGGSIVRCVPYALIRFVEED